MESLAKRLLNNKGLNALCVPEELHEVEMVRYGVCVPATNLTKRTAIALKRTFNQKGENGTSIRFWRVLSPSHPSWQSDLSIEGLKRWGIIKGGI